LEDILGPRKPREQVNWFAEKMEQKLRINDHKGGWNGCGQDYLFDRMVEEAEELRKSLINLDWDAESETRKETVIREAADIANFAMMIADNVRKGKTDLNPMFESDLR